MITDTSQAEDLKRAQDFERMKALIMLVEKNVACPEKPLRDSKALTLKLAKNFNEAGELKMVEIKLMHFLFICLAESVSKGNLDSKKVITFLLEILNDKTSI